MMTAPAGTTIARDETMTIGPAGTTTDRGGTMMTAPAGTTIARGENMMTAPAGTTTARGGNMMTAPAGTTIARGGNMTIVPAGTMTDRAGDMMMETTNVELNGRLKIDQSVTNGLEESGKLRPSPMGLVPKLLGRRKERSDGNPPFSASHRLVWRWELLCLQPCFS